MIFFIFFIYCYYNFFLACLIHDDSYVKQPFALFVFLSSPLLFCLRVFLSWSLWPDTDVCFCLTRQCCAGPVSSREPNSQVTPAPCRLKDCNTLHMSYMPLYFIYLSFTQKWTKELYSLTLSVHRPRRRWACHMKRVNCKSSPPGWALHSAGGQ